MFVERFAPAWRRQATTPRNAQNFDITKVIGQDDVTLDGV